MKSIRVIFLALAAACSMSVLAQEPPVSKKVVKKWIRQREWSNGVALRLQPSVNTAAFYAA